MAEPQPSADGQQPTLRLSPSGLQVAVYERRSLDAMLGGPSGLGLANNAMKALCLLSGAGEGACLAEEVAAAGVEDRYFKMTTQAERHGIEARHPQYSGYAYIRGLVDLSLWPGGVAGWQKQWAGTHLVYGTCGAGIVYQVTPDTLCFGRYAPAPQGTFSPGLMPPAKAKEALEDLCHDYGPMRELSLMTEAPRVACGELWQLPPPKEVWGAGCVTLVGDAAHAMLPALGQGACQAIEDAVELAVTLHQAASAKAAAPTNGAASAQLSASELETALRRYEAVRGPHTAGVRNMAEATFKHAAGETWWARVKRECWFWLAPVSWMRPAVSWITQRRLSWDGPPVECS